MKVIFNCTKKENTQSLHVLERNHYVREGTIRQGHFWRGKGIVDLELFAVLRLDKFKEDKGLLEDVIG